MLIVQPEAEQDIIEARLWYEEQRVGLGGELLAELDRVFGLIEEGPHRFSVIHRDGRKASLRRFPYYVIFVERGLDILILGVIHQRRDPKVARRRLG